MLDFNHGTLKKQTYAERLRQAVDAALEKESAAQARRGYLGASMLGGPCARAIQYGYMGAPVDAGFSGKTLRIFEVGHRLEDMAITWLRKAGLDLRNQKPDGAQFGFSVADGRIRGHIDGVVVGGPADLGPYPYLFEHKALGVKSWAKMAKDGLHASNQTYAAQVALYQAYMDLADHPALFVATNRDTLELYIERVPFEPKLAQDTSDKAVRILQAVEAGEMLPRIAETRDFYQCRLCSYQGVCWGGGDTGL